MVVAETLEQAEHAASLVRVEYERTERRASFEELKAEADVPTDIMGEPPKSRSATPRRPWRKRQFKVDHFYRTPRHNHNAIEPHATIAIWDGDRQPRRLRFDPIRQRIRSTS